MDTRDHGKTNTAGLFKPAVLFSLPAYYWRRILNLCRDRSRQIAQVFSPVCRAATYFVDPEHCYPARMAAHPFPFTCRKVFFGEALGIVREHARNHDSAGGRGRDVNRASCDLNPLETNRSTRRHNWRRFRRLF